MPFRRSSSSNLSLLRAAVGRLGAWVGVLVLLAQMLAPLPQAQAADWTADGLFPPTCSVHGDDQGQTSPPMAGDCAQCPLCVVSLGDRLLAPQSPSGAAYAPVAARERPARDRHAPRLTAAAHPPLPSRGPPAA